MMGRALVEFLDFPNHFHMVGLSGAGAYITNAL